MGEKLIEEVRQCPPLWDKQVLEYKNQPLKQVLWKEIENELTIKGNYIYFTVYIMKKCYLCIHVYQHSIC